MAGFDTSLAVAGLALIGVIGTAVVQALGARKGSQPDNQSALNQTFRDLCDELREYAEQLKSGWAAESKRLKAECAAERRQYWAFIRELQAFIRALGHEPPDLPASLITAAHPPDEEVLEEIDRLLEEPPAPIKPTDLKRVDKWTKRRG